MDKRVTILDIAKKAGVSTGTVHRAVYGKKGVSDECRARILEICAQCGYSINASASALKRGTVHIAVAFPRPEAKDHWFYSNVWQGFHRYVDELRDYKLDIVELPYSTDIPHSQAIELQSCLYRWGDQLDGLITIGHFDPNCKKVIRAYRERGIPIFLACDDAVGCGRIVCVQSNYDVTGAMTAELLSSQVPPDSAILLCAGDHLIPSHARTVAGFERFIRNSGAELEIIRLYGYQNEGELRELLAKTLDARQDIRGAFSVSARLSVLLAEAVEERELTDRIRIIASDLFEENIQNMKRGIVKNIIYKDPEQQAYCAAKIMGDYLLKGQQPLEEIQYVESRIIFQSTLDLF